MPPSTAGRSTNAPPCSGESHCKGVGCIIDGVPSRLPLTEADIQPQLTRRRPGQSVLTTPRDEADKVNHSPPLDPPQHSSLALARPQRWPLPVCSLTSLARSHVARSQVTILSGTERGHTLGTPVALMVENLNVRPKDYAEMSQVRRPSVGLTASTRQRRHRATPYSQELFLTV